MKRQKIPFTICAITLLLLLYIIIFGFSAQDGDHSGNLSMGFSRWTTEILNGITGSQWSEQKVLETAGCFEHPFRKLGHFGEYAIMGILVYCIFFAWTDRSRKWYFITILWVVVSAGADEFHQYFVPGRNGNVMDVLLDTFGGICGMLFCAMLMQRIVKSRESGTLYL